MIPLSKQLKAVRSNWRISSAPSPLTRCFSSGLFSSEQFQTAVRSKLLARPFKFDRTVSGIMSFCSNSKQIRNASTASTLPTKKQASVLRRTLTDEQEGLVEEQIALLKEVKAELEDLKAVAEDIELIQKSLAQLEDLFLLVIIGEFNSGKSSFLNALLGKRVLKEGVTPTTSKIGMIKYGENVKIEEDHGTDLEAQDRENITMPVDWLRDISLVDTPGTNAVVKGHQQITEQFVPRSDMVLFVTSVDRAFSESERKFLSLVRQWKKKIVVVLSKLDMLETQAELEEIQNFVRKNFKDMLGIEPVIFPVSSKRALNAKIESLDADALANNPNWIKSRFGELESYILNALTKEERTKLKLENPLGVIEHLLNKYSSGIESRRKILKDDLQTLQNIQRQMSEFKNDMAREYQLQQFRVDNQLLLMSQRGEKFFEDKLGITSIFELLRVDKFKTDFEKEVISETPKDIERQVNDIIDWMLTKHGRLWNDVMDYLQRRGNLGSNDIMGKINMTFDYNRNNLLQTIGQGANEVLASYNRERESQKLSNELKQALVSTAAIEAGAIGIGTLFTASLIDITGVLGVGALAATGLAILPYKRATMKRAFADKIADMRQRLTSTLGTHYNLEQANSIRKLEDAIEPYSRFVKTERERLEALESKFKSQHDAVRDLRQRIESSFTKKK